MTRFTTAASLSTYLNDSMRTRLRLPSLSRSSLSTLSKSARPAVPAHPASDSVCPRRRALRSDRDGLLDALAHACLDHPAACSSGLDALRLEDVPVRYQHAA